MVYKLIKRHRLSYRIFLKSKIQLYAVYIPTLNIYTQTGAGQLLRQESAFQAQRPELNRG